MDETERSILVKWVTQVLKGRIVTSEKGVNFHRIHVSLPRLSNPPSTGYLNYQKSLLIIYLSSKPGVSKFYFVEQHVSIVLVLLLHKS